MSTDLTVTPVAGNRDLREFIMLPFGSTRASEQWVPPLISERKRHLDRRRNPFFRTPTPSTSSPAAATGSSAGSAPSSTAASTSSRTTTGGMFGFFECDDDPEVAQALVDAAIELDCASAAATR